MLPTISGVFRLTRDPEVRPIPGNENGTVMVSMRLAASRYYKGQDEASYFDATWFVFPDSKKIPNLKKGTQISVTGEMKSNEATGKDGNKKTYYDILVRNSSSLDILQQSGGGQPYAATSYEAPAQQQQQAQPQQQQQQQQQQLQSQGWNPPTQQNWQPVQQAVQQPVQQQQAQPQQPYQAHQQSFIPPAQQEQVPQDQVLPQQFPSQGTTPPPPPPGQPQGTPDTSGIGGHAPPGV